jgi:hypothetical protein
MLHVCRFQKDDLGVIDIKTIQAVIGMVPFPLKTEEEKKPEIRAKYHDCFYVAEKPFFELTIEGFGESGTQENHGGSNGE